MSASASSSNSTWTISISAWRRSSRASTFKVDNKLGDGTGEKISVNLRFKKMDDFSPAAIARQVPALAKLLEAREQLANLLRYMDGKVAASDQIKALLADPAAHGGAQGRALSEQPAQPSDRAAVIRARWSMAAAAGTGSVRQTRRVETRDPDEFAALLKQSFKPRTERAATEVENAVTTLVQQALADTSLIKDDVLDTIEEMIARLDEKLTAQINEILHAPEFQKIESAWRGLHYLVFNSETDATLKIRVMNVSKNELYRNLQALSRRALGPEPAVQEDLRARVRPARRRALSAA